MTQTTTTETRQFTTAKKFAAHVTKLLGGKYVKSLNALDGDSRLVELRNACERYVRWSREDGGIEQGYDPAMYAFWQAVASGRIDGTTHLAIREWNVWRLLEQVHTLRFAHETINPNEYARYLMGLHLQPSK